MVAKPAPRLPAGDGWLYEPTWDGFRALVYRDGDRVELHSRELKPLQRYFPDLMEPVRRSLPPRAIVDGAIVIPGERGLDFPALLQRIHPAPARVALLAQRAPAALVLWDLLALGDQDLRYLPFWQRRRRLEQLLAGVTAPIVLSPATRDRAVAMEWLGRFAGGGMDGVVAKRRDAAFQPGEPALVEVRRRRTATCVVGGFRFRPDGHERAVESLLLGLHDEAGRLRHVGIASGFTPTRARRLTRELAPWRAHALDGHPWRDWGSDGSDGRRLGTALPTWEPLRPERICEVTFDHLRGARFRQATRFVRWRPDGRPLDCRCDQLEERPPAELAQLFAAPHAADDRSPLSAPLDAAASERVLM